MKKFVSFIFCFLLASFIFAERPIVRDIQAAKGRGTKINVYWTLPENPSQEIVSLCLYRNTKQITSSKHIETSTLIAELPADSTGYTDSVKDFKDYFYAVIAVTKKQNSKKSAETEITASPYLVIMTSLNSTVRGVHLEPAKKPDTPIATNEEEKLYEAGTMRETPLPYLDIIEGLDEESLISKETVNSTKNLSASTVTNSSEEMQPYFFEEDLISPEGGDDYLLFEVLKNTFVQEKYNASIPQLSELTKTRISKSVQDRAFFYIGQAYYFTGRYSEAVMSFIQVEKVYPMLTKKWINKSLDKLAVSKPNED